VLDESRELLLQELHSCSQRQAVVSDANIICIGREPYIHTAPAALTNHATRESYHSSQVPQEQYHTRSCWRCIWSC